MRNSNCVAIAPTATISNIIGVAQSIEPSFRNLSVKSNLSGEFTVVNEYLVRDLKALGLWDEVMVADLKYFDGSLGAIDRVPDDLKALYATAFEIDAPWLVEAAARRQKWIDQAQSLNIYMAGASGKKLDETYKLAWLRGLKTTYYLRTLARRTPRSRRCKGTDGKLNASRPCDDVGSARSSCRRPPRRRICPARWRARSTIPTAKPASKQQEQRRRQCSTGPNQLRPHAGMPPFLAAQPTAAADQTGLGAIDAAAAACPSTTSG